MPMLSRCPLCRGVMADSRAECRCPRCGEVVLPAVRKLCAICGQDVTREKRVRDPAGEYYCHGCWDTRLAARGERAGYVCNTCGQLFPTESVYQDGEELVCHRCYDRRSSDPDALLAAAADAGDTAPVVFAPATYRRPAAGFPWGLVSFAIALLVVLTGLVVILSVR